MNSVDNVKGPFRRSLEELLSAGRSQLDCVVSALGRADDLSAEWAALLQRMHDASALFPIRPFHMFYQRDFERAAQPLFVGFDDEVNNDHFAEISEEQIERLIEKYQIPVVAATDSVFDATASFFRKMASRIVTLRFFSNSEVLLKRYEAIIAPPWAYSIAPKGAPTQVRPPLWMVGQNPIYAYPPHLMIEAVRQANIKTLRQLKSKLEEAVATLETTIVELPFADKLARPANVPQVLIDYSTHIGESTRIDGSAIGPNASRER